MPSKTLPKKITVKQKMSKKLPPHVQSHGNLDSHRFLDRFRISISVLCDDNLPPEDICHDWFIDPESDILQGWCIDHTRFGWQQGIGIIDAALVMAEQVSGGDFQTKEEAYPSPVVVQESVPDQESAKPRMSKDAIRSILLEHGFSIHEGYTDIRNYVYEAIEAILQEFHRLSETQSSLPLVAACEKCGGTRGGVPGNENRLNDVVLCDACTQDAIDYSEKRQQEIVSRYTRIRVVEENVRIDRRLAWSEMGHDKKVCYNTFTGEVIGETYRQVTGSLWLAFLKTDHIGIYMLETQAQDAVLKAHRDHEKQVHS